MTNEKLLKELRRIEADLLTERGEAAAFISVQKLIIEVENDIRADLNKQAGKGSIAKAAQNILKEAQRVQRNREAFHKAQRTGKSLNVCDNYRFVRFNLEGAPTLPEHPASFKDYPDVDRFIIGMAGVCVEVHVPSRAELLAHIKTEKAKLAAKKDKSGVRIVLTSNFELTFHVNAEYLLDMLDALPGAIVTGNTKNHETCMLYFKAKNGDGGLCQLKRPKANEE